MADATQLQMRHGTSTQCDAMTPAAREPIVDTTNKRIRIGDSVTAGGVHLPNSKDMQNNTMTYAVVGGTANALTITLAPIPEALVAGMSFEIKAAANNTGAVTAALNGMVAKNVKKMVAGALSSLEANDIVAGGIYIFYYDGTQFQLINVPAAASGAMELLAVATASSSASLDFTSGIDSAYKNYAFLLNGVKPATTSTTLNLRVRRSGQGSFDSGAFNYSVAAYSNITSITPPSDTYMTLTGTITTTSYGVSGWLDMLRNVSGEYAAFRWNINGFFSNVNYWGGGNRDTTTVLDGVQFRYSSGNIAEGEIYMYGLKDTL